MKLQTAARKRAKIKMALQGPSGSGKTYSSLLLSYGLCGDWSKVAVIDTENGSANLYSHLGDYNIIELPIPYSPERNIEAIDICEKAGIEVIILDSVTHEWEHLLDYHASLPGNSFTNWTKVTPRHNAFVQKILSSPCHIISTIRTKQDYILQEKNGKIVPEKVGLKSVQRDGLEYEMTIVFDIDIKNNATASKDRTDLFQNKGAQKLTSETGRLIAEWCDTESEIIKTYIEERIHECMTNQDLLALYNLYPQHQEQLKPQFEARKIALNSVQFAR